MPCSAPKLVRDLILDFVPDEWLHGLDYADDGLRWLALSGIEAPGRSVRQSMQQFQT